jgi:rhodanese-related sulfurtransferase
MPGPRRLLPFLLLAACGGGELDWRTVKAEIAARFPEIEQLTPAELAAWRADPERVQPLLLDARTAAEFEVSRLRGAHLADTKEKALALLRGKRRNYPVVAYGAVGYRSAVLARRLRAHGYTRVFNLDGSIFQWANEGRPVYAGEKPARHVHPYNDAWGALLDRELWADPGQ